MSKIISISTASTSFVIPPRIAGGQPQVNVIGVLYGLDDQGVLYQFNDGQMKLTPPFWQKVTESPKKGLL